MYSPCQLLNHARNWNLHRNCFPSTWYCYLLYELSINDQFERTSHGSYWSFQMFVIIFNHKKSQEPSWGSSFHLMLQVKRQVVQHTWQLAIMESYNNHNTCIGGLFRSLYVKVYNHICGFSNLLALLKEVLEKNRLLIIQKICQHATNLMWEQNWKDKQCKFYKTQIEGHKKVVELEDEVVKSRCEI